MRSLHPTVLAVCLWAGGIFFTPPAIAQPDLTREFKDPPRAARPHTWWHWMNGNISREGITADLEAMARIGLGGFQLFNVSESIPEGSVLYNSDEWRALVKHAAAEAARLGLEMCVHNCAGWSSSGGPWVTPEHAMQTVVSSETRATGPARFSAALPTPPIHAGTKFYRDIAVLAFPTPKNDSARIDDIRAKALYEYRYGLLPAGAPGPAEASIPRSAVLDLTSKLRADGVLEWDVPAGEWTVLRFGHTPTGAVNAPAPTSGRGLEVDKMSREALRAYWAGGMAPLLKELGPLAGSALNNVLIDSYEVGCQNWTPKFREEFTARCGYDPSQFLPVMTGRFVENAAVSERFLWDLRRTIGDLFADHYYSAFAEIARENNLATSVEPYDGPFECAQVSRDAAVVMGEFWVNGFMVPSCKLASSGAHVHGIPIVGAESFTAFPEVGRWQNHPGSLKAIGDLMLTEGVNRYIMHRYAHQPWKNVEPGMTMGQWGTHFERTNTWWDHGGPEWITYLARCQSLLQKGTFSADVLLFAGESSPNGVPYNTTIKAKGYDYDVCGPDVLADAVVTNGRIALKSGMSYAVLVLPDTPSMTPRLAERIASLVKAGATVIGPKPARSPSLSGYPRCDEIVSKIGAEVWGDCDGTNVKERAFGAGRVVWGREIHEVLAGMGVDPDCRFTTPGGIKPKAAWIHRRIDDREVYFVSNQSPRSELIECSFRISGRVPSLWHAGSGITEPAPVWRQDGGRTIIPVRFEPHGSVFVVFEPGAAADHLVAVQAPPSPEDARRMPKIEILSAHYEAIDGTGGVDVTRKVAAMVADGETEIPATNALFGDPTYNHLKRLRVEYTRDGTRLNISAAENSVLALIETAGQEAPEPYRLRTNAAGTPELCAFTPGTYRLTSSTGTITTLEVKTVPPPAKITGPWTVQFQPGRGAPPRVPFDSLVSWTNHADPGVKYFSGTAEYTAEFTAPEGMLGPNSVIVLDLGSVREIAEVSLNGTAVGTRWARPFSINVTDALKPGRNTLSVRVTNLWVNRLIGDEQFPEDRQWNGVSLKAWPEWFDHRSDSPLRGRPARERLTFTTWRHWNKDSPLTDSGLLGPVVLRAGVLAPITK